MVVANSPTVSLERHEVDDLYGRFLDRSLNAGLCVTTGQSEEVLPAGFFRRLGHDLASSDVQVVADLHGPELWSFLEGGPIDILKVSHKDLQADGLLCDGPVTDEALFEARGRLVEAGTKSVVLSRQHEPTLAWFGTTWYVSGINAGINTGHSIIHSGTVCAALTARTFRMKGLAISLDQSDPWHWETAAKFAAAAARWLVNRVEGPHVLNVNVPAVPPEDVAGIHWADLDEFGYIRVANAFVVGTTPVRRRFAEGAVRSGV